jgi:phenylalanyl-tRNA synthetase beta subunit
MLLAGPLASLVPEGKTRKEALFEGGYGWVESDSPTFFPGRHADIVVKGVKVGEFGIIHPTVLEKFDIPNTVTAMELNIEPFCFDQIYQDLPTHAR